MPTSGGKPRWKKIPKKWLTPPTGTVDKRYVRVVGKVEGGKVIEAKVETSDDPSFKKARKAVRKVNRDAYTFRPDVLLTVGVDVANGRVVIKEMQGVNGGMEQIQHFDTMHHAIELAARCYCLKERTRLGIFRRECTHPEHRIKKQRYVVDEEMRNGKVVRTIYKHAYFCTRCGEKVRDA